MINYFKWSKMVILWTSSLEQEKEQQLLSGDIDLH